MLAEAARKQVIDRTDTARKWDLVLQQSTDCDESLGVLVAQRVLTQRPFVIVVEGTLPNAKKAVVGLYSSLAGTES